MPRACFALVLAALFLLGGAVELGAELPLDKIKDPAIRTRLRLVGLQIFFGETTVAMTNAHAIGWEVFHQGKKGQERVLAYSVALQGLAEATLELNREALWHWSMAQILLPELEGEVLQAYSGIAELCSRARSSKPTAASPSSSTAVPSAAGALPSPGSNKRAGCWHPAGISSPQSSSPRNRFRLHKGSHRRSTVSVLRSHFWSTQTGGFSRLLSSGVARIPWPSLRHCIR
jgi:hypothetical protein